jgi:hypothetical protein
MLLVSYAEKAAKTKKDRGEEQGRTVLMCRSTPSRSTGSAWQSALKDSKSNSISVNAKHIA